MLTTFHALRLKFETMFPTRLGIDIALPILLNISSRNGNLNRSMKVEVIQSTRLATGLQNCAAIRLLMGFFPPSSSPCDKIKEGCGSTEAGGGVP